MKTLQKIALMVPVLAGSQALAHPGHDHTHVPGGEAHLWLIGTAALVVLGIGVALYRQHKTRQ